MTELFHYTTLDGCRGIIENKNLWATRWDCLNDMSETMIYKQAFTKEIKGDIPRFCPPSDNPDYDRAVEIFVDAARDALGEVFIISFCKHTDNFIRQHGLLSMWRSYANGGVALVFDEEKLTESLRSLCFHHEVQYILDNSDSAYIKAAADFFHNPTYNSIDQLIEDEHFPTTMRRMIVGCKHYGFHEEMEHRYITWDGAQLETKLSTRKNGKTKIYVELTIDITKDLVKKIIVGPGRLQTENHKAIAEIARNLNIEVRKSDIPYQ
jgi:hypothetical protein